MEKAKALGGSFKISYTSDKNCKGDDSTAQGNIKEWGHTNKSKSTNEHTHLHAARDDVGGADTNIMFTSQVGWLLHWCSTALLVQTGYIVP